MRTILKACTLTLLTLLCLTARPNAQAQGIAASGTLTDQVSNANLTFKFYKANFHAGDAVRVRWIGGAHLRMNLYDQYTNKPILDANGNPIAIQYNGPLYYGLIPTLTLTIPVDAPNAILVLKNPETQSGQVSFQLETYNTLTEMTAPTCWVNYPSFTRIGNQIRVDYTLSNLGTGIIGSSKADILVSYAGLPYPYTILNSWLRGYALPGGSVVGNTLYVGSTANYITFLVSNTTFGETFTTNFNFLINLN